MTNLLGAAANVLPSTSTNAEMEESTSANPSGKTCGRKPYPLDANGNKIQPEKENQNTGQTQKKSKK
jgi:hypothetical protein